MMAPAEPAQGIECDAKRWVTVAHNAEQNRDDAGSAGRNSTKERAGLMFFTEPPCGEKTPAGPADGNTKLDVAVVTSGMQPMAIMTAEGLSCTAGLVEYSVRGVA